MKTAKEAILKVLEKKLPYKSKETVKLLKL